MNIDALLKKIITKRNRVVSLLIQSYSKLRVYIEVLALYILALPANLFLKKNLGDIEYIRIDGNKNNNELIINCMGSVDIEDTSHYKDDIQSIDNLLQSADFSLASAMNETTPNVTKKTKQMLDEHKIKLLTSEQLISDSIFICDEGRIGVITYQRSRTASTKKNMKQEIMRHILRLKKEKADYIIIYVNNRIARNRISHRQTQLYRLLREMGVDYIVGVTPNRIDGGITNKSRSGSSRCIFSLGSFLTNDAHLSDKRVAVRLKLRRINGKLEIFEETYFPYYHIENSGFESLIDSPVKLSEKDRRKYLGEIESEMRRLRPANRLLTLGKVMEIINIPLPEKYKYMENFSVGRICSRVLEVTPGSVFFFREPLHDKNDLLPVKTKRRYRIAKRAAKNGAMMIITYQELPFRCNSVLCDNVIEAHISMCAYLRQQFEIKTIGITGSIGKTSTKDMLSEVIRTQYNTVKNERNTNVQGKIGVNIEMLNSSCEAYIQEIGGGRAGGASRHSRMICPEITVVTNIGDAHIGNFGSKEKLMENKLAVIDGMPENGVVYLNCDDPLLANVRPDCETVFFAVHNKQAQFYAENIEEKNAKTHFEIVNGEKRVPVTLNVLGEYNVLNAVCCYAIGTKLNIPPQQILAGLANFHTSGIRQNLVEVCGRKFFMDCYNASSDSVKSAMETLVKIDIEPGKKRIVVIGDITGLGEASEQIHRDIGITISRFRTDNILLFGDDVKYTYDVLHDAGIEAKLITEREELNKQLAALINVGDIALFKGSSKMLLEYSVDMVFGTKMTDERLLDEVNFKQVLHNYVTYNLFSDYATTATYTPPSNGERKVVIPDNIGSIKVVNIDNTFAGSNISEISIPETIRHIGTEAFMDCVQLTEIKLPSNLKFIGNRAFRNCRQLRSIELPNSLMHLGKDAFADCTNLQRIYIPESVVQIGRNAFLGCNKCEFVCKKESFAAKYFTEAGIIPVLKD